MANKFSIDGIGSGLLSEVSKQVDTKNRFMVISLPLAKITPNENNKYSINPEEIEDLKFSILHNGLKQNLEVLKIDDEHYKLITGHRRFIALNELYADGNTEFELVPCLVTNLDDVDLPLSPSTKELYAITTTNREQRTYTDADYMQEVEAMKKVYSELQANGYVLTGRQRDFVAKRLNISPAQVQRIDFVNKNAIPEVKAEISAENMSINVASAVAHLPEKEQKKIITENNPAELSAEKLKSITKKEEKKKVKRAVRYEKEKMQDGKEADENFTIRQNDFLIIISKIRKIYFDNGENIKVTASDYDLFLQYKSNIEIEINKINKLINK